MASHLFYKASCRNKKMISLFVLWFACFIYRLLVYFTLPSFRCFLQYVLLSFRLLRRLSPFFVLWIKVFFCCYYHYYNIIVIITTIAANYFSWYASQWCWQRMCCTDSPHRYLDVSKECDVDSLLSSLTWMRTSTHNDDFWIQRSNSQEKF